MPDYVKPSSDPNVLVEPVTNRDGVALNATADAQILLLGRNPSDGRVDTFDPQTIVTAINSLATLLGGQMVLNPTGVKTAAYTAVPSDFIPIDATSAVVPITLPAAPPDKTVIGMKVIAGGVGATGTLTNPPTVTRGGSDVFNAAGGSTSVTLQLKLEGVLLLYSAALGVWYVFSTSTPLSGLDLRYAAAGSGGAADASTTVKGVSKLATAPASAANPIAAGDNDPRLTDQRVPTDGSVTAVKVNAALKPSGSAVATDEALRALGAGATQAAAGNDTRFPTAGQKNALAGTNGTPGTGNEFVTTSDPRNTDARAPTAHTHVAAALTPGTPASGKYFDGAAGWTTLPAGGGGGLPSNILTKTANFTAAANDYILADATGGVFTITLPSGTAGQTIAVKKIDASANAVAVVVTGGGSIDGDTGGASIIALNAGAVLECTAAGVWKITAAMGATSGPNALTATTVKTAPYTLAAWDLVPVDATGGTVALTLPTAPADKSQVAVKLIAVSGANTATIARGGSTDVFNKAGGGTSLTLSLLNQGVILEYAAGPAIWYVIADDLSLAQLDLRYVANPMTTLGDLILGGASGAPGRLAKGTPGQAVVVDSTGTVAWGQGSNVIANTQAASYTLVLADAGKSIEMNLGTATVLTVPPNSSVAFPIGTVIEVCRLGAGTVTIAQGASVVIRNRLEAAGTTNRTLPSQYSAASLRKRATDEWVLVGDIA